MHGSHNGQQTRDDLIGNLCVQQAGIVGIVLVFVAVIGYLWLGEQMSALKAVSLAMIVVGVVGLNLAGAH